MPSTPQKRRKQKDKHITARCLTLVDAKGKPRISMDAGDGDGYAAISLWGEDGRSIQISTEPGGGLHICLFGKSGKASAGIGITSKESAGLSFSDREGRLGTLLGTVQDSNEHALVLFRNGQRYWSSLKPKLQKRKKRVAS